jgi:putative acetyltransferase
MHGWVSAKGSLRMRELRIARESPDQAEILILLGASDRYHAALYPAESNHLVDVSSLMATNVRFLVAREAEGPAIGCGAIVLGKDADIATAELKRMWVNPAIRGAGLGRRLLEALEAAAAAEGVALLRLETGVSQPEALGLYKTAGYRERGPFGSYTADPLSVFMEKAINGGTIDGNT